MILTHIEMCGFRGAKNHVKVEIPNGFLIVVGRNGTGKSTICDAIEFVLNGTIREHGHKEKRETYDDYLWWRGPTPAQEKFVRLGFMDENGIKYVATRTPDGIDPQSATVLQQLYGNGAPDQALVAISRTSLLRDEEITALSVDLPEVDRYKFVRDAWEQFLSLESTNDWKQ